MSRSNLPQHNERAFGRAKSSGKSRAKTPRSVTTVSQFPQPMVPAWLRSLSTMHRGAKIAFVSIFGLTAAVYGYTAYSQGIWKQEHRQLQMLQVQASEQGVMIENIKQQRATAAEQSDSQLVAPDPASQILTMPSAPPRPAQPLPQPSVRPLASQPPSGY